MRLQWVRPRSFVSKENPPMKLALSSLIVCTVLAFGLSGSFAAEPGKSGGAAKKEDAKNKPINAKCPVQGEDIDPKVTTAYKGKTIAFCCESCIDDFKKDPEKYMKQIAADNKKADDAKKGEKGKGKSVDKSDSQAAGKAAKPVNTLCAVHPDDAVDPTVTTVYEGKVIGFCCEDCQKKFDLDPKAYAAKLK
jgi:YHS domain-containing protein